MDGQRDNFSYDEAVDEIARRYGVPKSVYQKMRGQESGDNDNAVSPVGAFSAWQIMPGTARGLGYQPQELKDEPLKAAEGGLRILRDNYKMFRQYAQNEKHAWMMAVAGYHTNPKNVLKDIKSGGQGLPMTSDGLITTRDHVLKIFDGLKGETLDRSPLGNVQNNFQPQSISGPKTFIDPERLPKVSLPEVSSEPTFQTSPPALADLEKYRADVAAGIVNAVTPARRNILQKRLAEADEGLKALRNENAPPVDDLQANREYLETKLQTAKTSAERVQIRQSLKKLDQSVSVAKSETMSPTNPVNPAPLPTDSGKLVDKDGKIIADETENQTQIETLGAIPGTENGFPTSADKPGAELPPVPDEYKKDFGEFLKAAELPDNEDSRRQYVQTVLAPLAQTEAKQTEQFNSDSEKYNRDLENYSRQNQSARLPANTPQTPNASNIPNALEIPKDESRTAIVNPDNDDEVRNTLAGTAEIDLTKKPKGVPLQDYLFRSAINSIGAKYDLTDEQKQTAEKAIRAGAGKLLRESYADITDENYNQFLDEYKKSYGTSSMTINLTRNAVNAALTGNYRGAIDERLKKDLQTEQTERNLALSVSDKPIGKDEFENDVHPRDYNQEFEKQTNEKIFRSQNPDYDLYRTLQKQMTDEKINDPFSDGREPTKDEVIERMRVYKTAVEDAKSLEKTPFFGWLLAGAMGGVGRTNQALAGVARIVTSPFESLIGNGTYKYFQNVGAKSVILSQKTNETGGIGSELIKTVGGLPFDLARLAAFSRLPGGAVVGFALDSSLQSAGRGESYGQVIKEAVKGGSLGALFKVSGGVASKFESALIKPIARIGTVTGGTFAVEKAFGADNETAFRSALLNGIFEVSGTLGSLKNKVVKVWKDGKETTVKIEDDGSVIEYETKENSPADAEIVLDPDNDLYSQFNDYFGETKKPKNTASSPESPRFADYLKNPVESFRARKDIKENTIEIDNFDDNGDYSTTREYIPENLRPLRAELEQLRTDRAKAVDETYDLYKKSGFDDYGDFLDAHPELQKKLDAAETKLDEKNDAFIDRLDEFRAGKNESTEPAQNLHDKTAESFDIQTETIPAETSQAAETVRDSEPLQAEQKPQSAETPEQSAKLENLKTKLAAQGGEIVSAKLSDDGNIHIEWKQKNDLSPRQATVFEGGELKPSLVGRKTYVKDLIGETDTQRQPPTFGENPADGQQSLFDENSGRIQGENFSSSEIVEPRPVKNKFLNENKQSYERAQRAEGITEAATDYDILRHFEAEGMDAPFSRKGENIPAKSSQIETAEWSPSSPKEKTFRSLDVERHSELDRKRGDKITAEFEAVAGLSPRELLKNAEIKFKDGILYTNAEATELLRHADYVAFKDAESFSYFGRYLNPLNAERIGSALYLNLGDIRIKDREIAPRMKHFVSQFEKARLASKIGDVRQVVTAKNVPYGLKAARQEETAHANDYALGDEHKIAEKIFASDELGRRAMNQIRKSGYSNFSDAALAREVAAKIWLDTATADLKMSQAQINHLRDTYVKSLFSEGKTFADFETAFKQVSKSSRNYIQESNDGKTTTERTTETGPKNAGTRSGAEGIARTDGKTVAGGERETFGNGAAGGKSNAAGLTLYERKFIESKTKDAPEIEKAVIDEIAFSKPSGKDEMSFGDYVLDITNGIPRALKATLDWSAPGRQGWVLTLSNPVAGAKAFLQQTKSFFSASAHQKFVESLENHPLTRVMRKSGLYLNSLADNTQLNQREEQFMSRLLGDEKFFSNKNLEDFRQGLTYPVRSSERAFSGYLDKIRAESFLHLARQVHESNQRSGVRDPELIQKQLDGVAKFVNIATGRGSLGRFENHAAILNLPFFSVRNWVSRFQVMNPAFYAALPKGARSAVLTQFGTFLGAQALAFVLLKQSGIADIETNSDSPDFMKVRLGQYRYDISGAIVQQMRYIAQMLKAGYEGDAPKAANTSLTYVRGKLSPTLGAFVNLATGSDISGKPTNLKNESAGLVTPISLSTITEGAKHDGTLGAILATPDLLGFSTSRYDNSLEAGQTLAALERELAKTKKGSDEAKELFKQIQLWRKYYKRAKKQEGELPIDFNLSPEEQKEKEQNQQDANNVSYDDETETEKPVKSYELAEKIEYYKANREKMFSFAKDQLESVIIQQAENMRVRGKLSPQLQNAVKEIIPGYEPLRENDGLDHRPEPPKKLPSRFKDLPKLPNRPPRPAMPD